MIVYKCKSKWAISSVIRRYVKMRVSDKNKRWHGKFRRLRGTRFWWKPFDSND